MKRCSVILSTFVLSSIVTTSHADPCQTVGLSIGGGGTSIGGEDPVVQQPTHNNLTPGLVQTKKSLYNTRLTIKTTS